MGHVDARHGHEERDREECRRCCAGRPCGGPCRSDPGGAGRCCAGHGVLLVVVPGREAGLLPASGDGQRGGEGAGTGPAIRADPESAAVDCCDDDRMRPSRLLLARALIWPLTPALLAGTFASEAAQPGSIGASSAPPTPRPWWPWSRAGSSASWSPVARRTSRRDGPFLGLGSAVAWSAFTDTYTELLHTSDGDAATYRLVATLSDSSFVWWFAFLALVLQLTPPPSTRPAAARRLPVVTLAVACTFQVMALLRSTHLDPPLERVTSPLAVDALSGVTRLLAAAAIYTLAACLLASVVELVVAWRRSEGDGRRQLLWLVAGAVPVAPASSERSRSPVRTTTTPRPCCSVARWSPSSPVLRCPCCATGCSTSSGSSPTRRRTPSRRSRWSSPLSSWSS